MAHGEWCLRPGEALDNNEYLQSQNGLFYAVMQPDGNFVIDRGEGWKSQEGQAMWSIRDDYEYGLISRYVEPGPYPGSHCAVMQPNGNFCVFNGIPAKEAKNIDKIRLAYGNDDYAAEWFAQHCVWDALDVRAFRAATTPAGDTTLTYPNYWVVMQDDGNLCIKLNGEIASSPYYHTSTFDRLVDEQHIKWTGLEYDLAKESHKPNGPPKSADAITAQNTSSAPQNPTLSISYTLTTSKGWKTSTTLKIGTKTEFTCGWPALAQGKVEVSAEFTQGFEWNEQTTTSQTRTINLPVSVPPGKTIMGQVTWQESALTVPFRVKGMGTFASGKTAPISFNGVYDGIASWDVQVKYIEVGKGEEHQTQAMLSAMPGTPVP